MSADEHEQKRIFAHELMRTPSDPFRAAGVVCPDDMGRRCQIANHWPSDPDVRQHLSDFWCDPVAVEATLPTKEALALEVLARARGQADPKAQAALYKQVADLMGYSPKTGSQINVNQTTDQRRVMVVRDFGSDEQWEDAAIAQQRKLTAAS